MATLVEGPKRWSEATSRHLRPSLATRLSSLGDWRSRVRISAPRYEETPVCGGLPRSGVLFSGDGGGGMAITAVHLLIYSDDPVATRSFFRDVLEWPFVEDDAAPGWLIFKSGASELGVHPTYVTHQGTTYEHPRHHSISLMCDDIEATKAELEVRGAEFRGVVEEAGFGRTLMLKLPGADDIMLYEPRHPEAYSL
jgi:predicted enzyme related to lactoylglutathione lyase